MVTDVLTPGAGGGPRMRRSGVPTSSALAYCLTGLLGAASLTVLGG